MRLNYIKCHGSGNEFILFDAVADNMESIDLSALAVAACNREAAIGADGILLLVQSSEGVYGMRMFNPDGSEAEMCGNGIRCVARLAQSYTQSEQFNLTSGGKIYPTARYSPIYGEIPTFGVEIGVNLWSADFAMSPSEQNNFIDRVIEPLHPTVRWTAISRSSRSSSTIICPTTSACCWRRPARSAAPFPNMCSAAGLNRWMEAAFTDAIF
jgi:diaminopimelate epimerase